MSHLSIFAESGEQTHSLKDFACIASTLSDLGVRFERWPISDELDEQADAEAVLHAYRHPVDLMSRRYSFKLIDVVDSSVNPGDAQLQHEHLHADFEILFFIEGDGLFFFHLDGKVYRVFCEKGDLISLPAGCVHWFDMGSNPYFKCIRFFTDEKGLQCQRTGSDIASRFPGYDEFKQSLESLILSSCPT